MDVNERNERIKEMFKEDLELLLRKGHDYSGKDDCMSNLRDFGFMGVIIRIGDKFHRLKNFVMSGKLQVTSETVIDTLRDLRNYGFLAQILYEGECEEEQSEEIAPCIICGKEVNGMVINDIAYDAGWWAHQECVDKLEIGFKENECGGFIPKAPKPGCRWATTTHIGIGALPLDEQKRAKKSKKKAEAKATKSILGLVGI